MLDYLAYLAPIVTLLLAALGVFFSKEGAPSAVTRVGYLILGLTLLSGMLAISDVYQKDVQSEQQKERIAELQRDARRTNNLLVATVAGINRKFEIANFWITIEALDQSMLEERERALGRKLASDEYVPSTVADRFIAGIVSKEDSGQVVSIAGQYLDYELKLLLKPKDRDHFVVEQTVSNSSRTYECGFDCSPDQNVKAKRESKQSRPHALEQTPLVMTESIASEVNFGLALSDGSEVGRVVSGLERRAVPIFTIESTFTKERDFRDFERITSAAAYGFKFYGRDVSSPTRECFLVIHAPIKPTVRHDESKLKTVIVLSSIEPLQVDTCETGP